MKEIREEVVHEAEAALDPAAGLHRVPGDADLVLDRESEESVRGLFHESVRVALRGLDQEIRGRGLAVVIRNGPAVVTDVEGAVRGNAVDL